MSKIKIKIGDLVFFFLFIATIAIFFCLIFKPNAKGKNQLVIENGKDKWIYQLDKDSLIEIPGKIGKSIIKIEDKKAFFSESACDNKICVFSKAISKNGEWTACLPNGVIIKIEGNNLEDEIDAFSK